MKIQFMKERFSIPFSMTEEQYERIFGRKNKGSSRPEKADSIAPSRKLVKEGKDGRSKTRGD